MGTTYARFVANRSRATRDLPRHLDQIHGKYLVPVPPSADLDDVAMQRTEAIPGWKPSLGKGIPSDLEKRYEWLLPVCRELMASTEPLDRVLDELSVRFRVELISSGSDWIQSRRQWRWCDSNA
jgi:hypothetical protein